MYVATGVVTDGVTTAQVRPVSLPAGPGPNANNLAPTDFGAITTAGDYSDHAGFGPINAGRNPVVRAKLQLNGHDRFSAQEGSYFNYYQTRAHTHTPADGINVYSFSLHPENHQPSGTANLSRIDSTLLVVTFADSLRSKSSGVPILDWTSDSKLFIFAFSYNILRIMSGMAGMAYSN